MATCDSCGAEILWAISDTTGKRMPMNPDPFVPPGLFVLLAGPSPASPPRALSLARATGPAGPRLYESHFATCPNAAEHRRSSG